MASSTYTDAKVIAMSKNFVNVVAHGEKGHKTREVLVGKEKQTWCEEYWGISCDVHEKAAQITGKFMKGGYGTPTTVICDPDGNELDRNPGAMGAGELVKFMEKNLAKIPGPKVGFAEWSAALKSVAAVDGHLEKDEFKKAVEAWQKLAKSKLKAVQEMAEAAKKKLEERGEALLSEAESKLESAVEEAKALLKKVAEQFKPLDCAKKAADLLKKK